MDRFVLSIISLSLRNQILRAEHDELKELKCSTVALGQPPRLIAMSGDKAKLTEALSSLAIFGNQLKQASTHVVALSTDGSSSTEWQSLDPSAYKSWLVDPYQYGAWLNYFQEMSENSVKGTIFDGLA